MTYEYYMSVTSELHALNDRIGRLMKDHASSRASKVSFLRNILKKHVPESLQVGRGFVVTPDRCSYQIDILIYDKSCPLLYKDGDLVFVTPDAAAAIIEVLPEIPNDARLVQILAKLSQNAEIVNSKPGYYPVSFRGNKSADPESKNNCFVGLFSFENKVENTVQVLAYLKRAAMANKSRIITHTALGRSFFYKYWQYSSRDQMEINCWEGYNLEQMNQFAGIHRDFARAHTYFFNSLISYLSPERTFSVYQSWFPIEGERQYKIGRAYLNDPPTRDKNKTPQQTFESNPNLRIQNKREIEHTNTNAYPNGFVYPNVYSDDQKRDVHPVWNQESEDMGSGKKREYASFIDPRTQEGTLDLEAMEAERKRKEEERQAEEARRRREEEERKAEETLKRREAEAKRREEASRKRREEEERRAEAARKRREEEERKTEEARKRRIAEAKKIDEEVKKRREEEARKAEEIRQKREAEEQKRQAEEIRRKEEKELKSRADAARIREEKARLKREEESRKRAEEDRKRKEEEEERKIIAARKLRMEKARQRLREENRKKKEQQQKSTVIKKENLPARVVVNSTEINRQDLEGNTALHRAATMGSVEEIVSLIDSGADVNIKNRSGNTPLHLASATNNTDVSELLLISNADVKVVNYDRNSPLHMAAINNNAEMVDMLMDNGADIDVKNNNQLTPLHQATIEGSVGAAEALIKRRAEIHARAQLGLTPLHLAALTGDVDAAHLLIVSGADVNAQAVDGNTPLHCAASRGHVKIIKLLIRSRADMSLANSREKTYLDNVEIGYKPEDMTIKGLKLLN